MNDIVEDAERKRDLDIMKYQLENGWTIVPGARGRNLL